MSKDRPMLLQIGIYSALLEARGKKPTHLEASPIWLNNLQMELTKAGDDETLTAPLFMTSGTRVRGLEIVSNRHKLVPEVQSRVDGKVTDFELIGDSED